MVTAGTGHVFHTTEIQEKQTDVERILGSEIGGHNLGREAFWMPVDPIRPPSLEVDSSATAGGGGRAHMPEDGPRPDLFSIYIGSLLTSQMPLLCFYTKRGQALLRFGNEKILLSNSRLTKLIDTAFNWKPSRQPNALNKKVQQKGGQVAAQTLLIKRWLRCPGSSSHVGIHANVQLGRKKKNQPKP